MASNIYDFSSRDILSRIARKRLEIGLDNLSYALELEGLNSDLDVFLWPEFSITRNTDRWVEGFPYGLFITWQQAELSFSPISIRPNTCGTLVSLLPLTSKSTLIKRITSWKGASYFNKKNVKLSQEDLSHRNHFLSFGNSDSYPNNTLAIVHTCPSIYKKPSTSRMGLYPSDLNKMNTGMKKFLRNGTYFKYLTGKQSNEYLKEFNYAESFSLKSRVDLIESIMDQPVESIANVTHQGIGPNYIYLGSSVNQKVFILMGNDSAAHTYLLYDIIDLGVIVKSNSLTKEFNSVSNFKVSPHGLGVEWQFQGREFSFYDESGSVHIVSSDGINFVYSTPNKIPIKFRSDAIAKKTLNLLQPKRIVKIGVFLSCKI